MDLVSHQIWTTECNQLPGHINFLTRRNFSTRFNTPLGLLGYIQLASPPLDMWTDKDDY